MRNIDPKSAKELLRSGEACLIDVRELSEHKAHSIKGSCHIPLAEINEDKIPADFKDKKIVIHCQRGGRSSSACVKLLKENSDLEIYNLDGGILAWEECGLETCKSEKFGSVMSLDRQVRLTAGLLVLIGAGFSFVNFNFIYLALFVGAGLTFSAIFDYCGMAKLLAIMPWNK